MTLAQAKEKLKTISYSLSKKDGEYRINSIGGKEATAYYTNDLDDAVNTAIAMYTKENTIPEGILVLSMNAVVTGALFSILGE